MSAAIALLMQAVAAHQAGLPEAEAQYRRVLELQADEPNALHLLGLLLCGRGETEAGLASIEAALAVAPGLAPAHFNRANILFGLVRFAPALAGYDATLALQPDFPGAQHNRARVLLELERPAEALAAAEAGLALTPNDVGLHLARGEALQDMGRLEQAHDCFRQAVALPAEDAVALTYRANALRVMGETDAALAVFAEALARDPNHAEAHFRVGGLLQRKGDHAGALAAYERTLAVAPGHAAARWSGQMCRLLLGDFSRWPQEWGAQAGEPATATRWPRAFAVSRWDGVLDLSGRRLLLHITQGFGDMLQFCRFAALAQQRGADVVLEVQRPLLRLMQRLDPPCELIAQGDPWPAVDLHCDVMDLPLPFGMTLDSIPVAPAYLSAEPAAVQAWRERLDAVPGRKIGLVWAGNPGLSERYNDHADRRRSMALEGLRPLASVPGVRFVSLQKDGPAAQAADVPELRLIDWTDELHDFADTAALVSALDLVISVDTSVVHLAGALGVPVWLLNRHDTCWRWLLDRDDSPWYPSLRQFRQDGADDWPGVIDRVRVALTAWAA